MYKKDIVCVICSDLLIPFDDVFHTSCGHVFHYECLVQRLKRSRTCPECRERTTENNIHRLHLNFSDNDSIKENATFLKSKIDDLTSQLTLRDKNLSQLTDINVKLEKQTAELRHEVQELQNEITEFKKEELTKKNTIHVLNNKIKYNKWQYNSDIDNHRKENKRLKENVQHLEKQMSIMSNRNKEIRDKYKTLHQNIQVNKHKYTIDGEDGDDEVVAEKRDNLEANNKEKSVMKISDSKPELEGTLKLKKNNSRIIIDSSTKPQGSFSTRDHGMKRKNSNNNLQEPSILVKKSRFDQPNQNDSYKIYKITDEEDIENCYDPISLVYYVKEN